MYLLLLVEKKNKLNMNKFKKTLALSICVSLCFLLWNCSDNDDDNNETNGKITILSNVKDPQIFNYETLDGYNCTVYGERDLSGMPQSIDYINMIDKDGNPFVNIEYNSNNRISRLSTSYSIIDISWETDTYATIAISLPDGSEQVYTELDLNRESTTFTPKNVPSLYEKRRDNLDENRLFDDTRNCNSPLAVKGNLSGEGMSLIANVYNQGETVPTYFAGDIYVRIDDKNNNILDKIKLKRANSGYAFYNIFPLCPNGITNPASSLDKILQLFKKSKKELEQEIEQLTQTLKNIEKDHFNVFAQGKSTVEAFREYAKKSIEIENILNTKKIEYKDRFETEVNLYCYGVLDGGVYVSENKYKALCGDEKIYDFKIFFDDTYISNIYLEPKNPKASTGGNYRLWIEMCNISAGTSIDISLFGTDGYTQNGHLTYETSYGLRRAYMDIPVAYTAGIKDKIDITLTKANWQTIKRNISTVFR